MGKPLKGMSLSSDGFAVMAGCVSRHEHITVETNGITEHDVWCDQCLQNVAVRFALKGITEKAVYDLGTVTACPECHAK